MVRPAGKRAVVSHLVQAHKFSQRRACRLAELNLSTWQYAPRRQEHWRLRERIKAPVLGLPAVKEITRRHGISEQSFYHWKAKYGGP